MSNYQRTAQYEQPRVPAEWRTGERKQFVIWLTRTLDEMYLKIGRMDMSYMNQATRDRWSVLVTQDDLSLALSQYGHHMGITAENGHVFAYGGEGAVTPEYLVFTAHPTQVFIGHWEYLDAAGEWQPYPGTEEGQERLVVYPEDVSFIGDEATIRVTSSAAGVYGSLALRKVREGGGTTVFMIPDTLVFATNETGDLYYQIRYVRVAAYDGTTKVAPQIGTITGIPDGMAITVASPSANLDVSLIMTVAAGATFGGERTGEIAVPVTVDDTLYQTKIPWTVVSDFTVADVKMFRLMAPYGLMFATPEDAVSLTMVGTRSGEEIPTDQVTYEWAYQINYDWVEVRDWTQFFLFVDGTDVPLAGTGDTGFRQYRCIATFEGQTYTDYATVSHAFKRSTQAYAEILNSIINVGITSAQYLGDKWSQGSTFPMNPEQGQSFTLVRAGDIPRFYIYDGAEWVEYAGGKLLGDGFRIEPGVFEIFTSNLLIRLLDPSNPTMSLVSMDSNGIIFTGKDGRTKFRFDLNTGNLTIEGIINATGGSIGGFIIEQDRITSGNMTLFSYGRFQIGDMFMDPRYGFIYGYEDDPYFAVSMSEVYINRPLIISPGNLPRTNAAANVYIDPNTGVVYLTSGGGGGTGTFTSSVSLNRYSGEPGVSITATATASGGVSPYQYTFTVYKDGVFYAAAPVGSSSTYTFVAGQAGQYRVTVTAVGNTGATATSWSSTATITQGTGSIQVTATASRTSASVGESVTFSASISGVSGTVSWMYNIVQNGVRISAGYGSSVSYTFQMAGNYYVEFEAGAGGGYYYGQTPVVVVSAGGGQSYSAATNGSNVRIRSSPTVNASTVTTLAHAGTRVSLVSYTQHADQGGSPGYYWYQVNYWSGSTNYGGYIRNDLLTLL